MSPVVERQSDVAGINRMDFKKMECHAVANLSLLYIDSQSAVNHQICTCDPRKNTQEHESMMNHEAIPETVLRGSGVK